MKICPICKKPVYATESQCYPIEYGSELCHLDCALKADEEKTADKNELIKRLEL